MLKTRLAPGKRVVKRKTYVYSEYSNLALPWQSITAKNQHLHKRKRPCAISEPIRPFFAAKIVNILFFYENVLWILPEALLISKIWSTVRNGRLKTFKSLATRSISEVGLHGTVSS